jgi:hypothetical protein
MATEDPIVWIYIGDYRSDIRHQLMIDKNFLHIAMVEHGCEEGDIWSKPVFEELKSRSLPRWFYQT